MRDVHDRILDLGFIKVPEVHKNNAFRLTVTSAIIIAALRLKMFTSRVSSLKIDSD